MPRQRVMTYAKGRGVEAVVFPATATERDPDAPRPDRSPMGYARRDAESTDAIMRGTIAEMQRLAAAIGHDHDAQRVAHALQQVMITAAQALALAGQVRGIQETTANFEETP